MFDELAPWVVKSDADVLCLQEVTRTPGLGGWTRFADAERVLPQRADLLGDVRGLLPGYDGVFTASDAGPVQGDGGVVHRQEFGVAVFVSDGLAVAEARSAFVHGDYVEYQDEWPSDHRPRAAQAVRVHDPRGQRFVTVVQVHGLRDARGKGDSPARREQAVRLAEFVAAVREDGDLTVVCGDFNLLPGSETFEILGGIGLVDLVGEADTRTSRYAKPLRHASYLLISDTDAVRRFEIVKEPEVSDHRALLLDL
jgi:endonuclease/exonuclease/phosphatase family metal-dependent hydrolase